MFEASIPGTVDAMLNSEAPLALRLTGQLLLGVVRIYARKIAYLHQVLAFRAFRAMGQTSMRFLSVCNSLVDSQFKKQSWLCLGCDVDAHANPWCVSS